MKLQNLLPATYFVTHEQANTLQTPALHGIPRSILSDQSLRPHLTAEQIATLRQRHDFLFWCAQNLHITDKATNRIIPFALNDPQVRFISECERLRLDGKPIHIICLKSRQWGCTTVVSAYMLWLLLYHHENTNLAICGNSHTIVGNIFNDYRRFLADPTLIDSLYNGGYCEPPDDDDGTHSSTTRRRSRKNIRPAPALKKVAPNTFSLGGALTTGNKLIAVSANNPDTARGLPVTMIHATEVAYWRSTAKTSPDNVVRSLCNGLPNQGSDSVVILESTANGTGNYFHSEWLNATAGKSDKVPVFIPWYETPYHTLPLDPGVTEEQFLQSLDEYEQTLLTKCNLSAEQINWYRHKRLEFREHIHMMAEYPSTPQEAFAAANRAVFSDADLDRMEQEILAFDHTLRPPEYGDLEARGSRGDAALSHIRFVQAPPGVTAGGHAPLVVWKHPDKSEAPGGKRYVISMDIGGRASTSDYSVISVFDRKDPEHPELVAQWRGHLDYDLLAWKAAQIATYYCIGLLAIESNSLESGFNSTDGKFLIEHLRRHYHNIYHRSDGNGHFTPGFHMNRLTKETVINRLIARVRDGTYRERALEFVNEARHFEYKTKRYGVPMGATPGAHDDIVMSRAIGLSICDDLASRRQTPIPLN